MISAVRYHLNMAEAPDLFPLGVATGVAHCNRAAEQAELKRNILAGDHTWLWGRRRMGKTSLIEQVVTALTRGRRKVAAAAMDLLVVHDAEDFAARLRTLVEGVSAQLVPARRKSGGKLAEAFSALNPQFSVGAMGLGVKLAPSARPEQGVAELLLGLDRAAGLHGRRVVVVFDEFQQLGALQPSSAQRSLEGAVRHAVERARHVSYIFAGSQRHLLAAMFEDEARPLYRLCRKMALGRIGAAEYAAFLRQASACWQRPITAEASDRILALTARHPHYVNALCARLWNAKQPPTPAAAEGAWARIVEEDQRVAAHQVLRLPSSQRALLKAIAAVEGGVRHPASLAFLAPLRLPTSTGNRAKELLEQEDFIRQERDGRWTLVDPVLTGYLRGLAK